MNLRTIVTYLLCLLFPVTGWAQSPSCADHKNFDTVIDLRLVMPDEPYYDLSKTIQDINRDTQQIKRDWLKQNGMHEIWRINDMVTQGVAIGGMGLINKSSLSMIPVAIDGPKIYNCLYFEKIDFEVFYRTMILIPRSFEKGSCHFIHINEHELLHHETNKETFTAFFEKFKKDIPHIIATIEDHPYMTLVDARDQIDQMVLALEAAFYIYFNNALGKELERRNNKIDSPEEYLRVPQIIEQCKRERAQNQAQNHH